MPCSISCAQLATLLAMTELQWAHLSVNGSLSLSIRSPGWIETVMFVARVEMANRLACSVHWQVYSPGTTGSKQATSRSATVPPFLMTVYIPWVNSSESHVPLPLYVQTPPHTQRMRHYTSLAPPNFCITHRLLNDSRLCSYRHIRIVLRVLSPAAVLYSSSREKKQQYVSPQIDVAVVGRVYGAGRRRGSSGGDVQGLGSGRQRRGEDKCRQVLHLRRQRTQSPANCGLVEKKTQPLSLCLTSYLHRESAHSIFILDCVAIEYDVGSYFPISYRVCLWLVHAVMHI